MKFEGFDKYQFYDSNYFLFIGHTPRYGEGPTLAVAGAFGANIEEAWAEIAKIGATKGRGLVDCVAVTWILGATPKTLVDKMKDAHWWLSPHQTPHTGTTYLDPLDMWGPAVLEWEAKRTLRALGEEHGPT